MFYVADTHALFWYLNSSPQLSNEVEEIFDFAEKGQGVIVIPSIVLAELLRILEKKERGKEFIEILHSLEKSPNYLIYPLDIQILKTLPLYPETFDLHDRIIMACAKILKAPVLTRDSKIQKVKGIKVLW